MQLLGTSLQCFPALPGAQRPCYSTAAEVGDEHEAKICSYLSESLYDNVFDSLGGAGTQLLPKP